MSTTDDLRLGEWKLEARLLAAVEDVQERIAEMEREGHHLRLHDHTRVTGTALIDAAYALRTALRAALIGDGDE